MSKRGYSAEQIIANLREAEVLLGKGETVGQVCRKIGVTEQTYYRWRKEYGGMHVDWGNIFTVLPFVLSCLVHNLVHNNQE